MKKLGEVLIEEGLVTSAQLVAALRAQVLYGGRIGTHFVEMQAIQLDDLTRALAIQLGATPALGKHFEHVGPDIAALMPAKMAIKHGAIPLGMVSLEPKTLAVAMLDPRKAAAPEVLAELSLACGARISVMIAPELRIFYYLEKLYQHTRKPRFLRTERGNTPAGATVRRAIALALVPSLEEPLSAFAPTPDPLDETGEGTLIQWPVTAARTLEAIDRATSGDEVGEALSAYLRFACGGGLVLMVRDQFALGWKGHAREVDPSVIESIALPLSSPSMLRQAWLQKKPFVGAPPQTGATLQTQLLKLLKAQAPKEITVAPVVVRDSAVLLIYAHAGADQALVLSQLAQRAASAFLRLISEAKRAA